MAITHRSDVVESARAMLKKAVSPLCLAASQSEIAKSHHQSFTNFSWTIRRNKKT
jgi:hypothetical protein